MLLPHRRDNKVNLKIEKQLASALAVAKRAAKWIAAVVAFAAFDALLQGAPTVEILLSTK